MLRSVCTPNVPSEPSGAEPHQGESPVGGPLVPHHPAGGVGTAQRHSRDLCRRGVGGCSVPNLRQSLPQRAALCSHIGSSLARDAEAGKPDWIPAPRHG